MSIKDIVEYQRIDLPIYQAEQELGRSEEKKSYLSLYDKINGGLKKMATLDDEVGDVFAQIEKWTKQLQEFSSAKANVSTLNDLKAVDNSIGYYDKLEKNLDNIESELSKLYQRLDNIKGEAYKITLKVKELQATFASAKAAYEAKSSAMKKDFDESYKELQALESKIDTKIMTSYKNLRKNQQMPALVAYSEGFCRGCGMNISSDLNEIIKDEGMVLECPNCRRLIYKSEK